MSEPRRRQLNQMSPETEPLLKGVTLAEWLISTQELRELLLEYCKSEPPINQDMAINREAEACHLRDDAEWFLTQETARATLAVAREHEDLAAAERRVMVKSRVADLQHLVDGLSVIASTIKSKIFSAMNRNRSGA